jgi:hypothetical protein
LNANETWRFLGARVWLCAQPITFIVPKNVPVE